MEPREIRHEVLVRAFDCPVCRGLFVLWSRGFGEIIPRLRSAIRRDHAEFRPGARGPLQCPSCTRALSIVTACECHEGLGRAIRLARSVRKLGAYSVEEAAERVLQGSSIFGSYLLCESAVSVVGSCCELELGHVGACEDAPPLH